MRENNLEALSKSEGIQHCRFPSPSSFHHSLFVALSLSSSRLSRCFVLLQGDLKALYDCNGARIERCLLLTLIDHRVAC